MGSYEHDIWRISNGFGSLFFTADAGLNSVLLNQRCMVCQLPPVINLPDSNGRRWSEREICLRHHNDRAAGIFALFCRLQPVAPPSDDPLFMTKERNTFLLL